MTCRITTRRGGQNGFWMSMPGFDARTALDANLLVSPGFKTIQFIARGYVTVTALASVQVLYGLALSINALVAWQSTNAGGINLVPAYQFAEREMLPLPRGYAICGTDRMTLVSQSPLTQVFRYLVFASGL